MLRITKESDYAFILLVQMAANPPAPADRKSFTAKDLADETHLPVPMVGKVLKLLARGGILTSRRGTRGGYELSRPPEAITAADVVSALEGPIGVTQCTHEVGKPCAVQMHCRLRGCWLRINAAIRAALTDVTLAEMAREAALTQPALTTAAAPHAAAR